MTVLSQVSDIRFQGDGVTRAFPIPFAFQLAADIKASVTDASGTIGFPSFTVSGAGSDTGGVAVFAVAPAAQTVVYIFRDPLIIQDASFVDHSKFPAKSNEAALDKRTEVEQRLARRADGAIHQAYGDPPVDMSLPPSQQRAGLLLGFGAGGQPIAVQVPNVTPLPPGAPERYLYAVDRVADLPSTYSDPHTTIYVRGYYQPGDGGGGVFVLDLASTRTPNGGTVFPAFIGNYIRQVENGELHTSAFGIKHDGTPGQAAKVQAFFVEAIGQGYCAVIDQGDSQGVGINCDNATIYLTQDGTRKAYKDPNGPKTAANSNRVFGLRVRGVSREGSILQNLILCVNPPSTEDTGAQPPGGAGGCRLSNFRVYGGVDAFDLQGDVMFDLLQVYFYVLVQREYGDVLPFLNSDPYGMNIFACNHQCLLDVGVYGTQNNPSSPNKPLGGGLRVAGCTNLLMISGAVNNNLHGLLVTSISFPSGKPGSLFGVNAHLQIYGTHMEGNNFNTMRLENVNGAKISTHLRPYNWNLAYACVELGSTTVGAARNVSFEDNYCVRSVVAAEIALGVAANTGALLNATNTQGLVIENNNVSGFDAAWQLLPLSRQSKVGGSNTYANNNTPLYVAPGATFAPDCEPMAGRPCPLASVTNVSVDFSLSQTGSLSLALTTANHKLVPKNMQPGMRYSFELSKAVAGAKVATWDPAFIFPDGAPPDGSAMTVGQTMILSMYCPSAGTSVVVTQVGTAYPAAAPASGS